jgi:2-hydroxy-6-oxonona-2,4-dienedioate hydrolase
MSRMKISDLGIEYELLGASGAPAVVVTPGGRFSKDAPGVRELGEAIAATGRRVLLWDRPNCGASDLCFDGEGEGKIQALVLSELIRALELGPVALVGGSAGARVSLLAALHDPTPVSHLVMWWVSGGIASLMMMGSGYCSELALAASMDGMEGVAALPAFAEQIRRNPSNRDIILRQDRQTFIATMERWAAGYLPAEPCAVPGVSREQLAALPMPVMIFNNSPLDFFHRAPITEWLHAAIPHSKLIELPWQYDVFAQRMKEAKSNGTGTGHFKDWPDLAPAIAAFIGH